MLYNSENNYNLLRKVELIETSLIYARVWYKGSRKFNVARYRLRIIVSHPERPMFETFMEKYMTTMTIELKTEEHIKTSEVIVEQR